MPRYVIVQIISVWKWKRWVEAKRAYRRREGHIFDGRRKVLKDWQITMMGATKVWKDWLISRG